MMQIIVMCRLQSPELVAAILLNLISQVESLLTVLCDTTSIAEFELKVSCLYLFYIVGG